MNMVQGTRGGEVLAVLTRRMETRTITTTSTTALSLHPPPLTVSFHSLSRYFSHTASFFLAAFTHSKLLQLPALHQFGQLQAHPLQREPNHIVAVSVKPLHKASRQVLQAVRTGLALPGA